jgi:DNA-binding CsgD family transcriptional regulator
MREENEFGLLTEKDYLKILDLLGTLYRCRSRKDFEQFCLDDLMPFMNMQWANYGWTDEKFNIQHLEQIGDYYLDPEIAIKSIHRDPLNQLMFSQARPVVGHDVDVPFSASWEAAKDLCNEFPSFQEWMKTSFGGLGTMDFPHSTFGFGMVRHVEKVITRWEVRILELLRPHIFQALKTILINEELSRYKSITEKLADVVRPIAVIGLDSRVLFSNRAFEGLDIIEKENKLSGEWNHKMENTLTQYQAGDSLSGLMEVPFFKVGEQNYTLTINPLENDESSNGGSLLLQLEIADGFRTHLQQMMQEAGLTGREKEVCVLVRDGILSSDISARLFISEHTVNTHLKNIHRKLDVHNRTELMSKLGS